MEHYLVTYCQLVIRMNLTLFPPVPRCVYLGFLDTKVEGQTGAVSVSDAEAVQLPKTAEFICIFYCGKS